MITKVLDIKELLAEKRWNISYLISDRTVSKTTSLCTFLPLSEIITERKGALNPQEHKTHLFNYLGLENIESHTGLLVNFSPVNGEKVMSRSKIFKQGDILYGRLRPNLNKVLLIEDSIEEGICSTEFYVLMPKKEKVMPYYLRYILASNYVLEKVNLLTAGTALPRIQLDDFLKIEVPVPTLEQQQGLESFLIESHTFLKKIKQKAQFFPAHILNELTLAIDNQSIPNLSKDVLATSEINWHNPLPKSVKSKVSYQLF
jgi:Type I restriction modification DNA specificity domain